jgi:hypothetical protein
MALVAVGRPRRVRWAGPPVEVVAGRVRHDLPRVLRRWRVRDDVVDEVATAVAELLDNIVRRACSAFCVLLELNERRLHVAVKEDPAVTAPIRPSEPTIAPRLRLVNPVALRRGWHQQDAGRTLWAEFSASGRPERLGASTAWDEAAAAKLAARVENARSTAGHVTAIAWDAASRAMCTRQAAREVRARSAELKVLAALAGRRLPAAGARPPRVTGRA